MSDTFLDHLPSRDREKIRKRMRSPEAYEKLRETVKGPEDLEREMEQNDRMAEAHLALESKPEAQERAKAMITGQGIEESFEMTDASPDAKKNLEAGKFKLTVRSHPETHQDALVAIPEGTVQEKVPVTKSLSDQIIQALNKGL